MSCPDCERLRADLIAAFQNANTLDFFGHPEPLELVLLELAGRLQQKPSADLGAPFYCHVGKCAGKGMSFDTLAEMREHGAKIHGING